MKLLHAATTLSLAILAGCSAQPKAMYQTPPQHGDKLADGTDYQGDWEGRPKFSLAKSQLVFDYKDKEKKLTQMVSVPAEAQPEADARTRFILIQDDPWGVDTHLKVTKIDNTDLVSSIGTEVEDKRVKYIETAGAVVVGLLGSMALDGTTPDLPLSIDSYKLLRDANISRKGGEVFGRAVSPDNQTKIEFKVLFGSVKDDALDNLVYANEAASEAQKTFIYSACRNATVSIANGPLAGQQFSATIADPRYVQTVKYPEKGSIDFHSACGANTTRNSSGASSTMDIVNAVVAQSKSVREAWKTEQSDDKANSSAALQAKAAKAAPPAAVAP
ncbi:hypothetical protein ACRS3X_05595 [Ectopseudomonas hydrolytica]|uniref:hypothetical protein n=1 Tax=Ectopseudomonas hydrolytica TaxID=2493633 RepID=UPI003EE32C9A